MGKLSDYKKLVVLEDALISSADYCREGRNEEEDRARAFCAYLAGYIQRDFPALAAVIDREVFKKEGA